MLLIIFKYLGTHVDVVKDEFPPSFSEYLQQKIREKFISITDPEKFGLPRVLDSIEVSCKTRQNIRLLANLLYDTAFSLKSPGSMTRLLEQKVPAIYLALEDVISQMSSDLRGQGHDPVLRQDQYEAMVTAELLSKNGLKFRDGSELRYKTIEKKTFSSLCIKQISIGHCKKIDKNIFHDSFTFLDQKIGPQIISIIYNLLYTNF